MKKWVYFVSAFLLVTMTECTFAADHYVRAGAIGQNNGSDWTNAWTDLPTSFVRGDTYYVAAGNYGPHLFDIPESGDLFISIKKATPVDHGEATDWSDSYSFGQAVFAESINFITGYWIWDGVTPKTDDLTADRSNPEVYGFRVIPNGSCDQDHRLVGMPGVGYSSKIVHHIIFSHTALINCGVSYDTWTQIGIYSLPRDENYRATDIIISDNYFRDASSNMLFRLWQNCIIERNYFASNWSSSSNHGQQISPGDNCDDITVRSNKFVDTSVFVLGIHKSDNKRWKVYNNIIVGGSMSAAFANADSAYLDVIKSSEFHHNTFINTNLGGRGAVFIGNLTDPDAHKSYSYNNLFYETINPVFTNPGFSANAITASHNSYRNCSGTIEISLGDDVTDGNPFNDLTNGDISLKQKTVPGKTLSPPFDIDFYERSRVDYWVRGASGVVNPFSRPTSLHVVR